MIFIADSESAWSIYLYENKIKPVTSLVFEIQVESTRVVIPVYYM